MIKFTLFVFYCFPIVYILNPIKNLRDFLTHKYIVFLEPSPLENVR